MVTRLGVIAEEAGVFPASELPSMISPFFSGEETHLWLVATKGDGTVVGFTYSQEEKFTDATWNLRCIAVHPEFHRQGMGKALLSATEKELETEQQARLVVIDTVGNDEFAGQAKFYSQGGYKEVARIPDFWGDGEDKLTFWKRVRPVDA
uniref:N-acetyltransferase domain-containing protein n=1 Tax=Chromera velia CCMP2878 TaxID=1169474 RepID=A0A0G4GTQ7_9ALVE|eukprot:Cvel_23364.t1-p1 / transcript=Cvel_23364.t1 / gene=Cvel_23364 / organism=Chromera_velia_CCMP2878 / gene_product=hypothetical protein / transcript_product=hypothetical protein / location=Cvel_scaffold2398:24738-25465(+) / protein_length=149 / sequence_SO=supercontig / SO=protein_coding / is_pseudo=false